MRRRPSFTYPGPKQKVASSPRRLVIRSTDTLVIGGYEVDAEILREVITPGKRLLWAFVGDANNVRPVAYSEERVVWLSEEDLDRS